VTGSSTFHLPGAGDYPLRPIASPGSSNWMYPPGGFMNFVQSTKIPPFTQSYPFVNYHNGSQRPENFHFVGSSMSHSTMSPTAACSKRTPSPTGSSAVDAAQMAGSQDQETIDVVDDDTIQSASSNGRSDARTDRRLNWSNEEDIRLVSAWLHNSIDPVEGNDKKSDQYWYDVTSTYNSTTKCDRMRNRNQLKLRWERIKKPVIEFNGCYARISKVHQSGMSDDQKMDQALQLYASEQHSDKPFTMMHVWRVLRHEQKWSAYVKKLNSEKDKSATSNPAQDDPKQRPIGHKKAKDERNRKTTSLSWPTCGFMCLVCHTGSFAISSTGTSHRRVFEQGCWSYASHSYPRRPQEISNHSELVHAAARFFVLFERSGFESGILQE